tara:strand:- start:4574 stop:5857 length:1284 start_codon:yes stop_codon:yes gene_type:complete
MLRCFLLIIFLIFSASGSSQVVKIYHGSGLSGIIDNNEDVLPEKEMFLKENQKIIIRIINPFPTLYKYEIKEEEIEIKNPEVPDITNLLTLLTGEINPESKPLVGGGTETSENDPEWIAKYIAEIKDIQQHIKDIKKEVVKADKRVNKNNALNNPDEEGFRYASKILKEKNELFKIQNGKTIEKYIEEFSTNIKKADNGNYNPEDSDQKFTMQLFDEYYKTLGKSATQLVRPYNSPKLNYKNFETTVGAKIKKIKISVISLDSTITVRDTKTIAELTLNPKFSRPILELVPTALLHKSSGGKKFSIEEGIINESAQDEFNFSAGLMLNLSFANWGDSNEYSTGIGVGFALVDNNLGNFFANANISYKKWIRFGVGYGFLRTPTGLKNGLGAGDSADDIPDLNELLTYERKPALFFTFVIPGLTLPLN